MDAMESELVLRWAGEKQLPEAVSVLDVAPTICALLGVPLDGVDGTPIPALLQDR